MSSSIKRRHRYKNKFIIYAVMAICFLVLLILLCFLKFYTREVYKVESRVTNLAKEKKKDNQEVKNVAWIKTQGTNIDYPVIYAPGYNLTSKTEDFAWTEADYKKLNNIIYLSGHNILNLSAHPEITDPEHTRFEQLMSYTYLDFIKDNQYIQYTFGDKDYIYKIYAVSYIDHSDVDFYNEEEYSKKTMNQWIKETIDSSIFDLGVDVKNTDKLISLTTCTRMYGDSDTSFVVSGRLLRDGERASISKVKTTSNYKKLEKIMKGGDSYEEA